MRGKKATRNQRKVIMDNGLNSYLWLVIQDTRKHNGKMLVLNKETGEKKYIQES